MIQKYRNLSIKIKLTSTLLALLFAISIFTFIYFPAMQKEQVIKATKSKIKNAAQRVAFGVAVGMDSGDFEAINTALDWAKQEKDLAYSALFGTNNKEIAAYNPSKLLLRDMVPTADNEIKETPGLLNVSVPVSYAGQNYGQLVLGVYLKSLDAHITSIRYTSALVSFIFVALGLGAALLINNQIAKPIATLEKAARNMSTGDLEQHIPDYGRNEIGSLSHSFREMIDNLRAKARAADQLAVGNLAVDIPLNSDKDQLGHAIISVRNNLLEMKNDLNRTIEAQKQGDLDARCHPERVRGTYAELLSDMNQALEAVVRPFYKTADILREYAAGNLEQQMETLPGKQCIITDSAATIRTNLDNLVRESKRLARAASEGKLSVRSNPAPFNGGYRDIIEGMNHTMESFTTPINDMVSALEAVAAGDLTHKMDAEYQGDYNKIKDAYNRSMKSLGGIIGNIRVTMERVASGTEQVAHSSQTVSDGATRQASAIQQINASMIDFKKQVRQNAQAANKADQLAQTVSEHAKGGNKKMNDMLKAMDAISESSNHIQRIINVIEEIAFQTNLLALNAAVEAARAGVHGKGFAVVAEEVRNLAQRSTKAAKETTEIIDESISNIRQGAEISGGTAQAFEQIADQTKKVNVLIAEINTASNHQTTGIDEMSNGLMQIDGITQTNTASAEETASAIQELSGQAESMRTALASFRVPRSKHPAKPVKHVEHKPLTPPVARPENNKGEIILDDFDFGTF